MSDFGSLLNQFQNDAKQWTSSTPNKRVAESVCRSSSQTEEQSRKRPRNELPDFASLPPIRKVFCVCPAEVQTGGPEALHQLCDKLNRHLSSSVKASMIYVRSNGRFVSHVPRARKPIAYKDLYNAPVATTNPLHSSKSQQSDGVLFVWPECWTAEMLDYLNFGPSPSPCAIWWLSVDNNTNKFQEWQRNDILHLFQSEYARHYLQQHHGAKHCLAMTEYISNPPDSISTTSSTLQERTVDVLYNPLKGIHYTDAIRKRSGHLLQFRPIGGGPDGRERLTPEEVRKLLRTAKIYIDFGPHPGMDRLPREAALAGCAVVTNRQGAAKYEEDVPLPSKYKVQDFDADRVHKLLVDLKDNFEERTSDFDEYRAWIRGQPRRMEECVNNLLNVLVAERQSNATSDLKAASKEAEPT